MFPQISDYELEFFKSWIQNFKVSNSTKNNRTRVVVKYFKLRPHLKNLTKT